MEVFLPKIGYINVHVVASSRDNWLYSSLASRHVLSRKLAIWLCIPLNTCFIVTFPPDNWLFGSMPMDNWLTVVYPRDNWLFFLFGQFQRSLEKIVCKIYGRRGFLFRLGPCIVYTITKIRKTFPQAPYIYGSVLHAKI